MSIGLPELPTMAESPEAMSVAQRVVGATVLLAASEREVGVDSVRQ